MEWFLPHHYIRSVIMIKSPLLKIYLWFAFAAALVYSTPVFFFIGKADYTKSWLLFTGNFLFMIVIGYFLFYISRSGLRPYRMLAMIKAGQKQVLRSVFFCLIMGIILLNILVPGKFMINKPANTNGLDFMVIVNSVIGNFFTGSFITVILAASLTGRLKKRKKSSRPGNVTDTKEPV
jgi:hypothetical protein